MSKTLRTKKRILGLLKRREMTISGLSQELGLSTATVSQHMEELQRTGVVEKIENEHFKKLKYYRAKEVTAPLVANYIKYVVGAVIVLALVAVALYSYHGKGNTYTATGTPYIAIASPGGAFACPMMFYSLNGTIENYSGFTLYYLNTSVGTVADYVIGKGETGKLYVAEQISGVLPEPSNLSSIFNQTHYATLYGFETSTNRTLVPSQAPQAMGVNYSVAPQNYTVKNNTTVYLNLSVVTNSTAANETYWLRIEVAVPWCDTGAPNGGK